MAGIDGFTQCVSNAFQKYVETGDFFTLASEWSDCNMNYFKELQQGELQVLLLISPHYSSF